MKLREYQEEAVEKMLWSLTISGNSVLSLPVGSGKTLIIAEFAVRLGKPVLILVPSKELLEQDLEKLAEVVDREEIGVFSASMNEKTVKKYTLATIQSAHKHPELFNHYMVCLIDECQMVNPKNLSGMYNKFFKAIGNPKVIGLTATPYRLDSFYRATGKKWQPWETVTTTKMITRYKDRFWENIIYVLNTHELQEQGHLCPLVYKDLKFFSHYQLPTNKSASDFDLMAFEELISGKEQNVITYLLGIQTKHKGILVFCSSISQAERLSGILNGSKVVTGLTHKKEREMTIKDFKSGKVKTVFNVGIYTKGFNYPELDAVVLLRPTKSLNLYNQMLGRATRTAEGKTHATIYDFSGNLSALGKLEDIKIKKIEGKWDVTTSTFPYGLHLKELYSYKIKPASNKEADHESFSL